MTTILEWLAGILGEYTPVTYDVYRIAGDTEVYDKVVASGLAGVDWQYIICGLLLLVTIYSTFRLLGILLQSIGGRR